MTRKNVNDKIEVLVLDAFMKYGRDKRYPIGKLNKELMQLIDSWVGEVLGEDTDIDDYGMEAHKNELRAEQRARAGLSTKGGTE